MSADLRECIEVSIPPGPDGVDVLMPALTAALDRSGPAIAPVPASGSAQYRERVHAAVRPGDPVPASVAVVVATSGSTGDPAGVLLPGPALRAATLGLGARYDAGRGHRWVAALPLQHAGGLMVAVRSVVAGAPPVAVPSLGGAEPFGVDGLAEATARARALSEADGLPLAVSLVPPMLALVDAAGAPGWDLLCEFDLVLVGGAATPRRLVDRLLFAGVSLVTSYGMTETCGGAVFDGRPLPGVSVSTDGTRRLLLSGDQVALGYRDGRSPDRWSVDTTGRRSFRTEDLGSVSADGRVAVTGRADDVVQVGGGSVSVGAVRAVLVADPRVAEAEVVALPDERWGARLVALVVPARSPADDVPSNETAQTERSAPLLGGGEHSAPHMARNAQSSSDLARNAHSESSPTTSGALVTRQVDPGVLVPGTYHGPEALSAELADGVAESLGSAARPREVRLVPGIPLLESGKPDRAALIQLAGSSLP